MNIHIADLPKCYFDKGKHYQEERHATDETLLLS